jgi:hypothetical protein
MAKKEMQEKQEEAVEAQPALEEVAPVEAPPVAAMPVEKKESHHKAAVDPNRALEQGRDEKPAHKGAQGEVEKLLIDAGKSNNQPLAAGCQMLLVKLGELEYQYSLFKAETQDQFNDQLKKLAELFSS